MGFPQNIIRIKRFSDYFGHISYYKKNLEKTSPPLEDWNRWLNVNLQKELDKLISNPDSRINNYIKNKDVIEGNIYRLVKLASLEIILRLIENGWNDISPIKS